MANENALIDSNHRASLLGVTDNAAAELRRLLVDPTTGRLKVSAVLSGDGTGDVSGPVSSTDNAIVRFDGTDGDTIQDSGLTIDDSDNLTLGGNLNLAGGDIVDTNGNELLTHTATASAVNHYNITNQVTGTAPQFKAVGDDTNIDVDLVPKGTGVLTLSGTQIALSDLSDGSDALKNIVEDTTPQLGGDLDLNGNALDFPTTANISDVLDEDDMNSNSATALATQQSIKAYVDNNGGLSAVVDDTTPQLGGNLDLNGNNFVDTNGNEVLTHTPTASAVNYIDIQNSATGDEVTISAEGDDSNINLFLEPKGSGDIYARQGGNLSEVVVRVASQTLVNKDLTATSNSFTAASATQSGVVELATAAETTTGTDTGRAVTPDGLAGSDYGIRVIEILVEAGDTDLATGDSLNGNFVSIPAELDGYNLVSVGAEVFTAGTTGNTDIQINNHTDSADMLSTVMRIETGETSTTTSAQAGTIDTANDDVAEGDVLTVDVDAVQTGTAPKGLVVRLGFQLP